MIKSEFKLIILVSLFGFVYVSPNTRYLGDISLNHKSSFLMSTVKYEDREKGL